MKRTFFINDQRIPREKTKKNGLFITQDKEKISCISKSGPGWLALHIACDDRKKVGIEEAIVVGENEGKVQCMIQQRMSC